MAQSILIPNYARINIKGTSALASDKTVGSTTLTVEYNDSLAADDYILVGEPGSEASELLQVQSVEGSQTVTPTAITTKYHKRGEQVSLLYGNKIKVYRAANVNGTTPADVSFSLIATVSIIVDQKQTEYTDTGGSSDYWYKFTYHNEASDVETNIAASAATRGGGYGNYASIEDIREKAGMQNNRWITDATIAKARSSAQSEINGALSGIYTLPFTQPINPTINYVTVLLAAGILLTADYGPITALNTDNGSAMIKEARATLEKLNTKQIVLVGEDGADTSIAGTAGSYSGWPNASTATAADASGGGDFMFRVSDRY